MMVDISDRGKDWKTEIKSLFFKPNEKEAKASK